MEGENHHGHHYSGGGSSNNTPAMADLRQFFSPIPTHHHQFPPPPTLYSPAVAFPHHYDSMMLVMGGAGAGVVQDFRSDNSAVVTASMVPSSSSAGGGSASGFDMENAAGGGFGLGMGTGDGGATARWPRQETLTLLEIRSRLDHKFKEANHKGPLWDEVSRIMCEEHGYQRSGKKCREKFENLYKYYKKTKEGKAGRQDGKHYRFFRQLEALYGDNSTHHNHPLMISTATATATSANAHEFHNSISLSNNDTSSNFSTSSSEDDVERGRSWKLKIKEFIESQMRKVMDKQEAWLEKMMSSLENREKERIMREEEWRKQEVIRMEREHRFWARERAWIEARDKALMDALQRITGKDIGALLTNDDQRWDEQEMMKLVELRASIQDRFDECGGGQGEIGLWDEISARMACLGHDRSAKICKEKWDFISKELSKKRSNHHNNHQYQHPQTTNMLYNYGEVLGQPPQPTTTNTMNDSCMRILLGDGEASPWESYGVKLNKGD